jgi:hypothetical protein
MMTTVSIHIPFSDHDIGVLAQYTPSKVLIIERNTMTREEKLVLKDLYPQPSTPITTADLYSQITSLPSTMRNAYDSAYSMATQMTFSRVTNAVRDSWNSSCAALVTEHDSWKSSILGYFYRHDITALNNEVDNAKSQAYQTLCKLAILWNDTQLQRLVSKKLYATQAGVLPYHPRLSYDMLRLWVRNQVSDCAAEIFTVGKGGEAVSVSGNDLVSEEHLPSLYINYRSSSPSRQVFLRLMHDQ